MSGDTPRLNEMRVSICRPTSGPYRGVRRRLQCECLAPRRVDRADDCPRRLGVAVEVYAHQRPSRANRKAIALPRPRDAPVTTATFHLRFMTPPHGQRIHAPAIRGRAAPIKNKTLSREASYRLTPEPFLSARRLAISAKAMTWALARLVYLPREPLAIPWRLRVAAQHCNAARSPKRRTNRAHGLFPGIGYVDCAGATPVPGCS